MNKNINTPHVYDNDKYADFFINKETEYFYSGFNLKFAHSHALFSSYEIDSGSRLLLKTLAPVLKKNRVNSILDAGCGTGVLGTALKKSIPDAELYLYDRDSLAVYFTEYNLKKNNIKDYSAANSLLMFPFSDKKYDLIISNLPAKAGKEVLGDFIQQAPLHLTENGITAVVIVKPLSDFAHETLEKCRLEILKTVKTANYSVFLFRYPEAVLKRINSEMNVIETDNRKPDNNKPCSIEADQIIAATEQNNEGNINTDNIHDLYIKSDDKLFESYIRKTRQLFDIKGNSITIDTATGLPDFDSLSFNTKLSAELILSIQESVKTDKNQLIINPGQGLIPVLLKSISSNEEDAETNIYISSNDYLQLKMTERNLKQLSPSEVRVFLNSPTVFHTIDSIEKGTLDTIIYFHSSVPGFRKHDVIIRRLNSLLKPGGKLILTSTASEISRFLKNSKGFVNVKGKKNKGIRAVFLKKSADSSYTED